MVFSDGVFGGDGVDVLGGVVDLVWYLIEYLGGLVVFGLV